MFKPVRNKFSSMPFIPYNIVEYLALDVEAENLWKLLKYSTYDCLSKPNLTLDEKLGMLCKNEDRQEDYSLFLSPLVENMIPEEKPILKIYKIITGFENNTEGLFGVANYRFDILYGGKMGIIEYQNTPCNRGDTIEMELIKSLNGADIKSGGGFMEFNPKLSRNCGSVLNLGNQTTYVGTSVVMAIRVVDLNDTGC